jgi:hypothetical protein
MARLSASLTAKGSEVSSIPPRKRPGGREEVDVEGRGAVV